MRRLILPGVLLIGAIASVCAVGLVQNVRSQDQEANTELAQADPVSDPMSLTSSFAQFPAETEAEKELEAMLAGPEDKIDLALATGS